MGDPGCRCNAWGALNRLSLIVAAITSCCCLQASRYISNTSPEIRGSSPSQTVTTHPSLYSNLLSCLIISSPVFTLDLCSFPYPRSRFSVP